MQGVIKRSHIISFSVLGAETVVINERKMWVTAGLFSRRWTAARKQNKKTKIKKERVLRTRRVPSSSSLHLYLNTRLVRERENGAAAAPRHRPFTVFCQLHDLVTPESDSFRGGRVFGRTRKLGEALQWRNTRLASLKCACLFLCCRCSSDVCFQHSSTALVNNTRDSRSELCACSSEVIHRHDVCIKRAGPNVNGRTSHWIKCNTPRLAVNCAPKTIMSPFRLTLAVFAYLVTSCLLPCDVAAQMTPTLSARIVRTKQGAVKGVLVIPSNRDLQPVEAFLGLPYAAPPVGALRFMPAVSPLPWNGVRLMDKFAPACPQTLPDVNNEREALRHVSRGRLQYLRRLLPYLRNQSEDCLYLNIYAPVVGECRSTCLFPGKYRRRSKGSPWHLNRTENPCQIELLSAARKKVWKSTAADDRCRSLWHVKRVQEHIRWPWPGGGHAGRATLPKETIAAGSNSVEREKRHFQRGRGSLSGQKLTSCALRFRPIPAGWTLKPTWLRGQNGRRRSSRHTRVSTLRARCPSRVFPAVSTINITRARRLHSAAAALALSDPFFYSVGQNVHLFSNVKAYRAQFSFPPICCYQTLSTNFFLYIYFFFFLKVCSR